MIKIIIKILGIIVILLTVYTIFKLYTFSIFEDKSKVINEIKIPDKNYLVRTYYIPSNATTESYIQVRKVFNDKESIIQNFARYNFLNEYKITNEDSLLLFVSDTSLSKAAIDKVWVKLPDSRK